jgi:repressor LexA
MMTLTEKQEKIFNYLKEIQRAGALSPTISEISEHFGFRSTRSARDHLKALERKGVIRRDANKARSIRVLKNEAEASRSVGLPLLGSIPAGHPEGKGQNIERYIHMDRQSMGFAPNEKSFALCVTGNSMTGRGIYDGDLVIVDGSKEPREGDVVAALIDNESTLKTLVKHGNEIFLKPENEKYPDMVPVNELMVQGVVRTIIRNVC